MFQRTIILRLVAALGLLALTGCVLDEEEPLRITLAKWLYLAQTDHFTSQSNCTVAVFQLAKTDLRKGALAKVVDYGDAITLIARGHPVFFDMANHSPNRVSEEVMSRDLGRGLGLLSAGVGPASDCVSEEHIKRGIYLIVTSDQTRTIYDPSRDALLLIYPPEQLVVYLRGTV